MNWFKIVKTYYDSGFYTTDQVKVFVIKGKITTEEYRTIVGEEYTV